jgi:K+-sensing histidine kinase KdpD
VSIRAQTQKSSLVLDVLDAGPGIPKLERERVTKKFYRMGNEETRSQKGSGLGLYLVQSLVELHGAQLSIQDNSPKGTIFSLKFN